MAVWVAGAHGVGDRPASSFKGVTVTHPAQPSEATREARDAIMAAVRETPNGVMALDLRDPAHFAWLTERLGGEADLERFFPASRAVLKATRERHEAEDGPQRITLLELADPPVDRWLPYVGMSFYGVTQDLSRVVAQGVVTLPGDATSVDISLEIHDNHRGGLKVADTSLPTQFNTLTQTINASAPINDPDNIDYSFLLTASFVPAGSTTAVPVVVLRELQGGNLVQQITVYNPNHDRHPQNDYIKVALNRNTGNQPDVDYWYNYGTGGGPTPIVGLQVNGFAQLVAGASVAPQPNFGGSCILQRRSGDGDGAALAFPTADLINACSGSGAVVNWNIGPDWFQNAPWDQNQNIDLDFNLTFQVTVSGLPQTAQLRITSLPTVVGANPPSNVGVIAPIKFVWGCVAAGTLVQLANGRSLAIEQVAIGDRVLSPDGEALTVRQTWTGRETKPVVRLALADGRSVVLTDEHPVMTPAGPRLARDLSAGDVVLTAKGPAVLASLEFAAFDGQVHNLDLAPEGVEPADLPDEAVTAFLAGGFAVGDNRMQGLMSQQADAERRARDPLLTLPEDWRLDIVNSRRRAAGLACLERHQPA